MKSTDVRLTTEELEVFVEYAYTMGYRNGAGGYIGGEDDRVALVMASRQSWDLNRVEFFSLPSPPKDGE